MGALAVLGIQAMCNCFAAKQLSGSQGASRHRLLVGAILFNVLLLAACKYSGAVLPVFASMAGLEAVLAQPFLPPGLSFVTFIQIAMLVDVGTRRQAFVGPLNTLRFLFFFPYMLSGPIARYGETTRQFDAPGALTFSWDNAARALTLFSLGLFKKTVLADNLAPFVDQGFLNAGSLEFFSAWISTLAYTLQLYFDFSGYSDMAIGAALLFNIRLPDNFLSPYKASYDRPALLEAVERLISACGLDFARGERVLVKPNLVSK
ncbi:MAG: MBOAT family O-acyltransferase, partial [Humidesulfovibrio sp.]|nr:MBOAT family O-acyltransferase [Humidesulfovibrio sp.]